MAFLVGFCYNNGVKYFLKLCWCAVSAILFWRTYEHFKNGLEYVYLHEILGSWLCIARGSAAVLNLNCAAVLLPMCHTFTLLINMAIRKIHINVRWLRFDMRSFHVFIGNIIFFTTAIHVAAHIFNVKSFCDKFHEFKDLNPFPFRPKSFTKIVFGTVAGITGVLMTFLLIILFVTSLKFIRRRLFNVFWYSHRLFVVFYALLIFHGFRGPLRMQVNVQQHYPGCNRTNTDILPTDLPSNTSQGEVNESELHVVCSEMPQFDHMGCQAWMWLCFPLTLYLCDLFLRLIRRSAAVGIEDIRRISEDTIELSVKMKSTHVCPGQYLLMNCGAVSAVEWHPFSVAQTPSASNKWTLKLWIKQSGDWTEEFINVASPKDPEDLSPRMLPMLKVDGPFSSSMENITKFKTAVCIAGGIGITPFLSHLLAIADNDTSHEKHDKIKRIHIICIMRDKSLLIDIFRIIHQAKLKINERIFVEDHYFYTGTKTLEDNYDTKELSDLDQVNFGRPSLDDIISEICLHSQSHSSTYGVFACGPPRLCADVRAQCNIFSNLKKRFVFHKEAF